MFKKIILLVFILLSMCDVYAQEKYSQFSFGLNYANSNVVRGNTENYYNYENQELGIYAAVINPIGKEKASLQWKWNWLLGVEMQLSDYEFKYSKNQTNPFRSGALIGVLADKPISYNWSITGEVAIGTGWQSGYEERLKKGIYFTEVLALGVKNKQEQNRWGWELKTGWRHVSNGNISQPNKGIDALFVQVGILTSW